MCFLLLNFSSSHIYKKLYIMCTCTLKGNVHVQIVANVKTEFSINIQISSNVE